MQEHNYKKKIMKYRLTKGVVVLAAILCIILAGVAFAHYAGRQTYETYEIVGEIQVTQSGNANWHQLDNTILTYTRDGANCVDQKGDVVWNRAYELQEPIVDICQGTVAIGEYNGTTIYIMNSEKELGEIDTRMPIKDFCVAENGLVAAILEDGSTTWIYVFDSKGTELINFKTTMQNSGYPIEIDLSNDGMLLAVSFLTLDQIQLKTKVAFYNFGEVGQNKSDMLVSGYDYSNAIVPTIEFLKDGSIFALADNRLMVYEGREIPLHAAELMINEEIQGITYSDEYIGLLFYSNDPTVKYNLTIYDTGTGVVGNILFDDYYSEILISGNQVIIYNENIFRIYKTNGQLLYEQQATEQIQKVICTSKSNRFMMVTESKIQIIEVR